MLRFQVSSNRQWLLMVGVVVFLVDFSLPSAVPREGMYMSDEALRELKLTRQEKVAFEEFKGAVLKDVKYDFIKQDLFLLRWIRAKDLDVNQAVRDMKYFLQFIRENKIDTILNEDWGDMEQDYPFYTNVTDRRGRPVAYGNVGNGDTWNVRRGMLQGKRGRLMRYTYKIVFDINDKLIRIGKHHPNVTQFIVLMNLENFNPFEHVCPLCVSTYVNLLDSYERYFPGFATEILVINAPQSYLVLVDTLKPFLSKSTRSALKIFGTNKNTWKPYLDARIDTRLLKNIDLDYK